MQQTACAAEIRTLSVFRHVGSRLLLARLLSLHAGSCCCCTHGGSSSLTHLLTAHSLIDMNACPRVSTHRRAQYGCLGSCAYGMRWSGSGARWCRWGAIHPASPSLHDLQAAYSGQALARQTQDGCRICTQSLFERQSCCRCLSA